MTTENAVPFSPIPTRRCRMKFDHDDTWDYEATPIRVAWESAYKDAALRLTFGDEAGARAAAQLGLDLESAYIARVCAEDLS